jgi:hypothetical protein
VSLLPCVCGDDASLLLVRFATRTDLTNKKKKYAQESAYFQAIRFFDEWLKA